FLASFCVVIIIALFYYLIPSLQDLFEDQKLHPMTEAVIGCSRFIHEYGVYILFSGLGAIACITFIIKNPKGKDSLKKFGLKMPILKTLMTQAILLRFTKVFSVLLTSGIPMLQALKLSKKAMNHREFEAVIEKAEKKIIEGKYLSRELQTSPLFPNLFIRMLAISEEAGNIPKMLENIGDIYEQDLDKSLGKFTSLLQPIMLLVLGLIVGVVLLSVLLPMTDVSSFVQ
ncbi:MAG: type II secretion system F family protein, partial [Simkaniaceae bacterium]|nr:type II secretion system F family protein [Simkaniaceae bacterium]